jgi:hypothetical protein
MVISSTRDPDEVLEILMADTKALFAEAMALVRGESKRRGFAGRGTTLYRVVDGSGNTASILVQKGKDSTAALARVTLTYGVYSAALGRRLADAAEVARDVWRAHWRDRLSTADGGEVWLTIGETETKDTVAARLVQAIDSILPVLLAHATDDALRREWLAGRCPGLTAFERWIYLAVLLDEAGRHDDVARVVSELMAAVAGTVHERVAESRLRHAGVRLPER